MYEKNNFINPEQNQKEEDPIEKLNISLNQLLVSLKSKEPFLSSETDTEIKSSNEEEISEQLNNNEGDNLLKQFQNLHNINGCATTNNNTKKINPKNIEIILGKIKEMKNANKNMKNEIKEFCTVFNNMIKVIIEGAKLKENEMTEKYLKNINKIKRELELTKKKMNKNSMNYKKNANLNLEKYLRINSKSLF